MGYTTVGIEISDVSLNETRKFCREYGLRLNMFKGDVRKLPFKNETFSFVYLQCNTHDVQEKCCSGNERNRASVEEEWIVLCEFRTADEPPHVGAVAINEGEFLKKDLPWHGVCEKCPNIDSYFKDEEPDVYFRNFKILHKEKRTIERITDGKQELQAYIDYIAQKR
jgi:ubiquinone/menaquinone biosynthesis C-methylase UbiE